MRRYEEIKRKSRRIEECHGEGMAKGQRMIYAALIPFTATNIITRPALFITRGKNVTRGWQKFYRRSSSRETALPLNSSATLFDLHIPAIRSA